MILNSHKKIDVFYISSKSSKCLSRAFASVVAKEMCKKKKKTSEEK